MARHVPKCLAIHKSLKGCVEDCVFVVEDQDQQSHEQYEEDIGYYHDGCHDVAIR